jgi:ABC-type multidrug transport system ATPase subunit
VASPAHLIGLRGLGVRVGQAAILRDLDFAVGPGEAVGIFGANGSGKTTLLRVVATLLRPSFGEGVVLGAPLGSSAAEAVRPRIGLIGHQPALYPQLSLEENTDFVASVTGTPQDRVGAVLGAVGLGRVRHRRADQCSHGMQRRAEFARLLLMGPDLMLFDEAHAGLDQNAAGLVGALVDGVRDRGGAAVLVSHEPGRIAPLVDRSLILDDGRLHPAPEAA